MVNIISLEEAKNLLRVDYEDDDKYIQNLIDTLPIYLKNKTGKSWDEEPINPLAKTLCKLLLSKWYGSFSDNSSQVEKSINDIIATLTPMGRE